MGQSGKLVFYTDAKPRDPRATLRALLEKAMPATILLVARSSRPDAEWKLLRRAVRRGEIAGYTPDTLLPRPHTVDSVVSAYRPRRRMSVQLIKDPIGPRIVEAVEREIPEDVRGKFIPSDLIYRIGWHDLFECAEHEEGHYFGRPFISVLFYGYFTPNDWKETRRRILELPEVNAVKAEFEEIAGPLETCVYWDI